MTSVKKDWVSSQVLQFMQGDLKIRTFPDVNCVCRDHESASSREELRKFIHKELVLYLLGSGLLCLSLKWNVGLGGTFDLISYLV